MAGHSVHPVSAFLYEELAWFANDNESILAVMVRDRIDNDYGAALLARDEVGRFRAFSNESSFQEEYQALRWIEQEMDRHTTAGITSYRQGDESAVIDLFTPAVPPGRMHPYFKALCNEEGYFSARSIIRETMPHFFDIDGNFVEQFQTTGFDSRLWELYLFEFLAEELFVFDRTHPRPDFMVTKFDQTIAIEAVTVGRRQDNPPELRVGPRASKSPEELQEALADEIPIRFGSALFSKLQKRYWELEHVRDHPIVFAIADFHDDQSMVWTTTGLVTYLYGRRFDHHYNESGELVVTGTSIGTHRLGTKEIPSGFFFQPNAENVSAVLFSASGTLSKFNRMGRQAGFTHPDVIMIRNGNCHDHDPNASIPAAFEYIVDENSDETWGEGMSMYHNPNAIHPVPDELFPGIAHHHFVDGMIRSHLPFFHPYASFTKIIKIIRDS